MKPNDKPGLHQSLVEKVFLPETEAELGAFCADDNRWIEYIEKTALKMQSDLNEAGLQCTVSGVIGAAMMRINSTNPHNHSNFSFKDDE